MDTARKRIIDFIESQGIKPGIFLKKTGLKKGFVDRSHQESGITDIYMSKILDAYPMLSAEWLLTGEGEMIKTKENTLGFSSHDKDNYIIELQKEKILTLENELVLLKKELSKTSSDNNVARGN